VNDEGRHCLAAVEHSSFWFTRRNELIVWALRRYFPRARRLLEVGCGSGVVLGAIRSAFPELSLVGGDVDRTALEIARTRLPGVELRELDVLGLPFQEEFDVAGAFDVLEHIEDDRGALTGLHRAVRSGGGLVVTVPQHRWLWSAADQPDHHRRYARDELAGKLRHAGFTPLRATSFVSLPLPLVVASRLGRRSISTPQLARQLHPGRAANAMLGRLLDAERALIRRGVDLPLGSSLLMVARRD
jgi:SAM-dependent methyltransferase